jgi:hypothetical protein
MPVENGCHPWMASVALHCAPTWLRVTSDEAVRRRSRPLWKMIVKSIVAEKHELWIIRCSVLEKGEVTNTRSPHCLNTVCARARAELVGNTGQHTCDARSGCQRGQTNQTPRTTHVSVTRRHSCARLWQVRLLQNGSAALVPVIRDGEF